MIGAFSPIAIFAVAAIANCLVKGQALNFSLLGQINFLPNLGMWAWLFWIFNSGIGEETGWRGFALPRLQKKKRAIAHSINLSRN